MVYDIIIGRNKEDQKKFQDKGVIYIGKGYVQMGNYISLSNRIYLDIIRSHVILIAGKRGSGKSYSIGVLAEEISDLPENIKENIAPIIFDTMGIFWTMKYKNEREIELLDEWNLKPRNLPVTIWVPSGYFEEYEKKEIPVDKKFAIAATELEIEDWIKIFNLKMIDSISIFIQKIISELKEKESFDLDDIIEKIKKQNVSDSKIKESALALFEAAKSWKVFAKKNEPSTKINELINRGKTTVLDLSIYPSNSTFNIRALLIGIISKKIFEERMIERKKEEIESIQYGIDYNVKQKKELPLVWIFIDEAHEFLPINKKTPATDSLVQILREGRQPGISLILATQQPGIIHRDVMTQSDIILSHKLTNKKDLEALNEIMQSYFLESIQKTMNSLPKQKGAAIILDDNSERLYTVKIRPRFTWHGGETPTAIKIKENILR
ncbi:MAG: DUF87 domain-containing protein [Candidatus Pacearchaeota archaeon]